MSEEKVEPNLKTIIADIREHLKLKGWQLEMIELVANRKLLKTVLKKLKDFEAFISTYGTSEAKDLDTQDYIIRDGKVYINKKKISGDK